MNRIEKGSNSGNPIYWLPSSTQVEQDDTLLSDKIKAFVHQVELLEKTLANFKKTGPMIEAIMKEQITNLSRAGEILQTISKHIDAFETNNGEPNKEQHLVNTHLCALSAILAQTQEQQLHLAKLEKVKEENGDAFQKIKF